LPWLTRLQSGERSSSERSNKRFGTGELPNGAKVVVTLSARALHIFLTVNRDLGPVSYRTGPKLYQFTDDLFR
jgi:hypothetical protein